MAEAKLAEIVKHKETAEGAEKRDDFQQLGKEVAAAETAKVEAEEAAKFPHKKTTVSPPPPPPPPPPPGGEDPHVGPAIELHHEKAPSWPLWLPLSVLLVFAAGSVLFVREGYVIHDDPRFVKAMALWAPVITADRNLAAPREVKRFVNKARYFAMRLRPQVERRSWLRRLLLPGPAESGRTKIGEADIVALTALQHLHPEWFAPPRGPKELPMEAILTGFDTANKRDNAITAVFRRHAYEFRSTPVDSEKENIFFAVVGEYTAQTPSVTDAKPSPTRPSQGSKPTA
jgi:hypothetical protein